MFVNYMRFYRYILTGKQKAIYMQMEDAFYQKKKEISIAKVDSSVNIDSIKKIIEYVYNDNPSLFYVDVGLFQYAEQTDSFMLRFTYLYSDEKIHEYELSIARVLRTFYKKNIKPEMSDYDKELASHNYLVSTIQYQKVECEKREAKDLDVYNVVGALVKRRAVCWGISCAFKLLCDYLKIKCIVTIGNSLPIEDNRYGHAWNIVQVNNKNYHVDVTWDLMIKGSEWQVYDFFNIDDAEIKRNHTWELDFYPVCKWHDDNYYFKNRCFVNKVEQLFPYFLKRLENGRTHCIVKFRGDLPQENRVAEEAAKALRTFLEKRNMFGKFGQSVSINRELKNIYVKFSLPI